LAPLYYVQANDGAAYFVAGGKVDALGLVELGHEEFNEVAAEGRGRV